MTTVTITRLETPAALFCLYGNEQEPQDCYIELNCRDGELTADYNAEIGNGIPMLVYHGHVRRYAIPLLTGTDANDLLADLSDLAQRVVDGYTSEWDGHNHRAQLTDDAQDAESAIDAALERLEPTLWWEDADEWLYEERHTLSARLVTGETIDALMAELDGDGTEDRPMLIGLRHWLENLRDDPLDQDG